MLKTRKEYLKCAVAHFIGSIFYYTGFVNLVRFLRRKILNRGRLIILMYHRISAPQNGNAHLYVSPVNFEMHLQYLRKNFNLISLDELSNYIEKRAYPKRDSVMLTFDDGWEDNYTNAFSLLKKYKAPALIFLVSGFIGKEEMLKSNQIEEMAKSRIKFGSGIAFGAHSKTHSRLSWLSPEEIKREVLDSKSEVEAIVNTQVVSFAYPYGLQDDFDHRVTGILEESGLSYVFTAIKMGDAIKGSKFLIPRKGIADFSLPAFASKIEGIFDFPSAFCGLFQSSSKPALE